MTALEELIELVEQTMASAIGPVFGKLGSIKSYELPGSRDSIMPRIASPTACLSRFGKIRKKKHRRKDRKTSRIRVRTVQ